MRTPLRVSPVPSPVVPGRAELPGTLHTISGKGLRYSCPHCPRFYGVGGQL